MGRVSLCEIHPAAYKRPASGVIDGSVMLQQMFLRLHGYLCSEKSTRPQQTKTLIIMLLFAATRVGGNGNVRVVSQNPKQNETKVRIHRDNRQAPVRQIRFSVPSAGCHGAYCCCCCYDCCAPSEASRARSREGGRTAQWRSHRRYHQR